MGIDHFWRLCLQDSLLLWKEKSGWVINSELKQLFVHWREKVDLGLWVMESYFIVSCQTNESLKLVPLVIINIVKSRYDHCECHLTLSIVYISRHQHSHSQCHIVKIGNTFIIIYCRVDYGQQLNQHRQQRRHRLSSLHHFLVANYIIRLSNHSEILVNFSSSSSTLSSSTTTTTTTTATTTITTTT